MAKALARAREEAAAYTSREVFAAIDEQRGQLTDRNAQDAMLQALIIDKGLQRVNNKTRSLSPHTVASLRKHISNRLGLHRDRTYNINELWTRGSSMLQVSYLQTIGMAQAAEMPASDAAEAVGEDKGNCPGPTEQQQGPDLNPIGVLQTGDSSSRERKRGIDEVEKDLDGDERPVKSAKIAQTTDISMSRAGSPQGRCSQKRSLEREETSDDVAAKRIRTDTVDADQEPPVGQQSMDVLATTCGIESGNLAELPVNEGFVQRAGQNAPQAQTSPTHDLSRLASEENAMAAEVTTPNHVLEHSVSGQVQEPRDSEVTSVKLAEEVASPQQDLPSKLPAANEHSPKDTSATPGKADDTGNRPARTTSDDHDRRRSHPPIRDYRETHASGLNKRDKDTVDQFPKDVFPPELPKPSAFNNAAILRYENVINMVKGAMSALDTHAQSFAINFCIPNGLQASEPAIFVQQPTPELKELYVRIFGDKDWLAKVLERQNQEVPWPLTASMVLRSLIAAHVYDRVFLAKLPWDIGETIGKALSDGRLVFVESALGDLGYDLSEILKQCNYKMMSDDQFEKNQVAEHARFLAQQLAVTLSPHLALLRRTQKPEERRFGSGPGNDTAWITYLEGLFQDAILLKGKIETYHDTTFEWLWPDSGAKMDAASMESLCCTQRVEQEVMLTIWPGLRAIHRGRAAKAGEPPSIFCAARASVFTTAKIV